MDGRVAIVGDELGCIKVVDLARGAVTSRHRLDASAHSGAPAPIAHLLRQGGEGVVAATATGEFYRLRGVEPPKIIDRHAVDGGVVGLDHLSSGRAVACSASGALMVLADETVHKLELLVGKNVASMRSCASEDVVATAGKEHELGVWSISQEKEIFRAKNVKNDHLNLRVPVDNRCLAFASQANSKIVCVGTGLGRLRVYDTRSGQRRPVRDIDASPNRRNGRSASVTSVDCTSDASIVVLGDTEGGIYGFDLGSGKPHGAYKGHSGSIIALSCHDDDQAIYSVGRDRHLHVHDTQTRQENKKIYLNNRLTAVTAAEKGEFEDAVERTSKRAKLDDDKDADADAEANADDDGDDDGDDDFDGDGDDDFDDDADDDGDDDFDDDADDDGDDDADDDGDDDADDVAKTQL